MFKASRRSLSTALLAICLLLTQALVLAQPSSTTSAAPAAQTIGPAIFLNISSVAQPTGGVLIAGGGPIATEITVTGTGFNSLSPVAITFNAPYGNDGEPLNPRPIPPVEPRPGDNRVGATTACLDGSGLDCVPVPATKQSYLASGAPGTIGNGAAFLAAATLTTPLPNTIVVCAYTDANGNFISAWNNPANNTNNPPVNPGSQCTNTTPLGPAFGGVLNSTINPEVGASVQIPVPGTVTSGVYDVVARDEGSAADLYNGGNSLSALAQFTVTGNTPAPLTATPISGSSVPIEGEFQVNSVNGFGEATDSPVYFYLANFDLYAVSGLDEAAGQTLPVPGEGLIPLIVKACATGAPGPTVNSCTSTSQGVVNATVQLQTPASVHVPTTAAPATPILSDEHLSTGIDPTGYFDQVFAIVATDTDLSSNTGCSQPALGGLPACLTNIHYATAGIHIDHGQPVIALSTNQVGFTGAVVVHGTGFGAFAPVVLYYVTLNGGTTAAGVLCGVGAASAAGCTNPSQLYFSTTYQSLASATTDANGSFTTTVGLSGIGVNGISLSEPGYILAEDFSGVYPSTYPWPVAPNPYAGNAPGGSVAIGAPRLNEAATAAVSVIAPTSGSLILQTAFPVTTSAAGAVTYTAAVSSTVTVVATGFLPNEAVTVSLDNTSSGCSSTVGGAAQPNVAVVATGSADGTGTATITFIVPELNSADGLTVTSNAYDSLLGPNDINGGNTILVCAAGGQSSITDSADLTIPPTTVMITPSNGLSSGTVLLAGSGFAASEPVTFEFGSIDPFTGQVTTPSLTVSGQTDVQGNVTIAGVSLPANLTGGLYTLQGIGLASDFGAAVSTAFPFIYVNGNLNCPTSVFPGQVFTVSGAAFLPNSSALVTLTPAGPLPVGLTTGPIPNPIFQQIVPLTASGTFVVTPTVPLGTAAGNFVLSVSGLVANATGGVFQQQLRECTITVGTPVPVISISPTSASIGGTITVNGSGFAPSEPITVELQYIDTTGVLTGTLVPGTAQAVTNTTTLGNFTATYTVASSVNALIAGTYNVTAIGTQTGVNTTTTGTTLGGGIARAPLIVTAEPQPALNTVYFAEGYTGTVASGAAADFTESLSILNANNYTTTYTVTYALEGPVSGQNVASGVSSSIVTKSGTLGPDSVVERSVNTDVGNNQKVAATISSPSPLGVERIISRSKAGKSLDSSSSLGQLLDLTSTATSFDYYFAGGEVMLTNEEYLTLLNPSGTTAANVTINILPQAVISATSVPTIAPIAVTVQPGARVTVPVRADVEKTGNGQIKFGMDVTTNVPVAAERVEYFGDGIGSGKYGATTTPGQSTLNRQFIFAKDSGTFPSTGGTGGIGTGNDVSEVDIVNPGAASAGSATVTVSFFGNTGAAINSQQVQVDGQTRETVSVNDVVGTQSDVFSVIVTSDKGVYAELPTFYGGDPSNGGTFAASELAGSPAGLTSVEIPYLDITGPTGAAISQTVYLYNPGATSITVRGIYISASGSTPVVNSSYTVAPNSILAVNVNADSSTLPAGARGAIFTIVNVGSNTPTPNTGQSFVVAALGNAPDFSNVVGEQGTYPLGAATGF